MRDHRHLVLAPAFDVLPMGQSLGYQAMCVGQRGAESSLENALSAADQFWLSPKDAAAELRQVAQVVDVWRPHFLAQGLSPAVCDELAQAIDRPFLRDQRRG